MMGRIKAQDSARWCEVCHAWGDHHTDRHEPTLVVEWCRRCRDEEPPKQVVAEFILWGKLFPPEHLGPRCTEHTAEAIGWGNLNRIDQYAIFDLRGLRR